MIRALTLLLAGLTAGAMNAVAGGGSFVSVPALIWLGVPSVTANMSSTLALYPGSLASAWAYRGQLRALAEIRLGPLVLITLLGGVGGALLLLHTSNASFDGIVPWLLLLGSLAFAFGKSLGARLRLGPPPNRAFLWVSQLALGFYGGYFGGAVGIMTMAAWMIAGVQDVHAINAVKVILVASANTVAAVLFVAGGSIAWVETGLMLGGATLGGYLGARLSLRVNPSSLRVGISVLNFIITAAFFALRALR